MNRAERRAVERRRKQLEGAAHVTIPADLFHLLVKNLDLAVEMNENLIPIMRGTGDVEVVTEWNDSVRKLIVVANMEAIRQ